MIQSSRSIGKATCPKVLILSKSYPNKVFDVLGLWVENLVRHSSSYCEPKVISPIPYCPPLPWLPEYYTRLRAIPERCWSNGIEVFHPRLFVGPGYSLHSFESAAYYMAVRRLVSRLRPEFPFRLIHAHFTYPDGWVAVRLGKHFRVPVIITEHAPWGAWWSKSTIVRRQSILAAQECAFQIAVSSSVRESIAHFTGESKKLLVIPGAVDKTVFTLPKDKQERIPNQVLFVGAIRPVKGVDLLLRATRLLIDSGRDIKLVLVGESYFRNYQREYERLRQMAQELDLGSHVDFVGKRKPPELVRFLQQSALLVLPSRAESLGMVLVEALACGTPVVATRCGGPEDIVTDEVGVLVQPEDPEALARGIAQVMERREYYDPVRLRARALERFGLDAVGNRLADLYEQALQVQRK